MTKKIYLCADAIGRAGASHTVYATCQNKVGTLGGAGLLDHGQFLSGADYTIYRAGLRFDMTTLASISGITVAKLHFSTQDQTTQDDAWEMHLVDGDALTFPFVVGNYQAIRPSVTSFGSKAFAAGAFPYRTDLAIDLNASGIAKIGLISKFQYGLRSNRDITIVAPTGVEYIANFGAYKTPGFFTTIATEILSTTKVRLTATIDPDRVANAVRPTYLYLEADGDGIWSNVGHKFLIAPARDGEASELTDLQDHVEWGGEDIVEELDGFTPGTLYTIKSVFYHSADASIFDVINNPATFTITKPGKLFAQVVN